MKKIILFLLAGFFGFSGLFAQDGEENDSPTPELDVFYGTRTLNQHTVKQMGKRVLGYRIQHRLGDVDGGLYEFFGLDGPASVFIGFDYGISDKLMVGIGRHSLGKLLEGFVKYTPLRQSKDNSIPVSLAVVGKANMTYLRDGAAPINGFDRFDDFSNRFSYFTQVMVARKFGDRFSLQLAPSWTHLNLVEFRNDANDIFAVTGQASFKFTKTLGVSGEYTYVINDHLATQNPLEVHNSAGVSLDIVTGGHVFQIVLVNSFEMNEVRAIPFTNTSWMDGKFRIGFNIARSFWL